MFNDPIAAKTFEEFQARFRFNTIFETGTNLAHGILNCSKYRENCVTVEINPEFRDRSLMNIQAAGYKMSEMQMFGSFGAIRMRKAEPSPERSIYSLLGNSPAVLDAVLASGRFPRPYLFYLDAHWQNYWPLLDELKVVAKHGLADSCIIIHDFYVPGKPFGYDSYPVPLGNGQFRVQRLDIDYVKQDLVAINPNFNGFYNTEACEGIPGRGILYVHPRD